MTLFVAMACGLASSQEATREGGASRLGPRPGADPSAGAFGGDQGLPIGGRLGPSASRVPRGVTRPGSDFLHESVAPSVTQPLDIPRIDLPNTYEVFEIEGETDAAPATGGLTLDEAINRLIAGNLDLRSKRLEIPKAQADVVTAGLRANPLLFYDTQFIPVYGGFGPTNVGGPTQYDLNVTIPLDLNHKRRARVLYACQARRVVEAQYADAVRRAIDELYQVHVDLLLANDALKFAGATLDGLEATLRDSDVDRERGDATLAEIEHRRIRRDAARLAVREARASEQAARLSLGPLLNLPRELVRTMPLAGSLSIEPPSLPPEDELVGLAMRQRPDLIALRLAQAGADSGVALARAERFQDVFLLAQPFTMQDLTPFGQSPSFAAAVGITIPLPLFDRNQGNIERARINSTQVGIELERAEQVVDTEVRQIVGQLASSQEALRVIGDELLPSARREVFDATARFARGEVGDDESLEARDQLNDLIRQQSDLMVRRRRAMLGLNTACGTRLMP